MKKLLEIFVYFFKLGFMAFGGPAAHIALMEKDLVSDKKWMTKQEFLDYIGITNLIPGPNSTEVTMHCGYHRGGIPGLFIAGVSFIFPAALLTGILAYVFYRYEDLTLLEYITSGFKVIVLIVIAQATYKLFKKAGKNNFLVGLSILASIIYWFYPNELVLLLGVGLLTWFLHMWKNQSMVSIMPFLFYSISDQDNHLGKIFFSFLKIGSILFGSGYVLFAYLDTLFVEQLGWLSGQDILDAVAIGQFTPGPVLSTATFIGYRLNGVSGAIFATIGIFLPSFIFVLITSPFIKKIRNSPLLSKILDSVNAVSLAFIFVVSIKLSMQILTSWQSFLVLIFGVILFYTTKLNTLIVLVLGGGLYTFLAFMF
jgi:chromate transporter